MREPSINSASSVCCCVVAAARDGLPDDQRVQKRLDHEAASQAFEHDGDIEAVAAKAAMRLVEQRADDAQFSKAAPQLAR